MTGGVDDDPLDQLSDAEAADCMKSNPCFSRSRNVMAGGAAAGGNEDGESDDEGDTFTKSYLETCVQSTGTAQGEETFRVLK